MTTTPIEPCDHPCADYFELGSCLCTGYKCAREDEHWRNELDYLYPSMPELEGVDIFLDECGPPTGDVV